MNTLEEAWNWYENTRGQLRLMRRLGGRYWEDLPWDKGLGGDNRFHDLEGDKVQAAADSSLSHLDDVAVVVLFSAFESLVRRRILREVEEEAATIQHRALKFAVEEARQAIAEGSFF